MLIDYHMHLERGPFSEDWFLLFWQKAKEKGIEEIGISEHGHRFIELRPVYKDLPYTDKWCDSSLEEYFLFINSMKKKYPVKLGIEMDYLPDKEKEIKEILENYEFDYVIGSVHWLNHGFGFDIDPNDERWKKESKQIFLDYFERLELAIKSGLFDIIGHIDLVKLWGYSPPENLTDIYLRIASMLKERALSIEINTSGLRRPVKEIYPSPKFLEILAPYDIPLTFGSDAHSPEDVGKNIEEYYNFVKNLGFKKLTIFEKRVPKYIDIK
ncbi:MAG: histidinol-phosphatase [Dictyoglomus sp. NZ13-RE01]|nr:MAG: histidinol-phosphatase [Dictyoglomus sp. NZ13-RE01]